MEVTDFACCAIIAVFKLDKLNSRKPSLFEIVRIESSNRTIIKVNRFDCFAFEIAVSPYREFTKFFALDNHYPEG